MDRDWSSLNSDLLRKIAEEHLELGDYVNSESVCKNWRSSIQDSNFYLRGPPVPWLMLPYCHQHNGCRCFYSISDGVIHHIEFPTGYDEKRCAGSSHGWLAIMEETSPCLFLLNPFTKQRIELPPVTTFPDILDFHQDRPGREYIVARDARKVEVSLKKLSGFYLHKVILSCDPTLPDCIVAAIFGHMSRLAYCRLGEDKWTEVHHDFTFQDEVIFWKGAFYAAGYTGSLLVFHPNTCSNSSPKVDVIFPRDDAKDLSDTGSGKYYLVADSVLDQLMLVCRDIDWIEDVHKTIRIHIYSLNEENKLWEMKKSLDGKVLFLGVNYTLCFHATDYPQLKPNTIYFTDDFCEGFPHGRTGGHNFGIFDIDEGIYRPLPYCDPNASLIHPPPVFVRPPRNVLAASTSST